MMMVLLVFTSCEEEEPVYEKPEESVLTELKDFRNMTDEEALDYFKNLGIDKMESNYESFRIDSLPLKSGRLNNVISVRSGYDCDVNVELSIGGPSNTAIVTVYDAGTSTIVEGPENMTNGDDFDMTINGADNYDFKIEPTGSPGSGTSGQLVIDPYYGGKTIAPFTGAGPHYVYNYNYQCPQPTDGTCDVELDITKLAGSATKYQVAVIPSDFSLPFPYAGNVLPGTFGSESVQMHIDDSKIYNIAVKPNPGSTYERFSVRITTPYLAYSYTFTLDTTDPNEEQALISNFDYFDCP